MLFWFVLIFGSLLVLFLHDNVECGESIEPGDIPELAQTLHHFVNVQRGQVNLGLIPALEVFEPLQNELSHVVYNGHVLAIEINRSVLLRCGVVFVQHRQGVFGSFIVQGGRRALEAEEQVDEALVQSVLLGG